jgi:hypothetical protein
MENGLQDKYRFAFNRLNYKLFMDQDLPVFPVWKINVHAAIAFAWEKNAPRLPFAKLTFET